MDSMTSENQLEQVGTNGNDTLVGSSGSDRIDGGRGDDVVIGNGGKDNLMGHGGDDYVESLNASGLTGLWGWRGDDTLVGSVESYGQIHMGGYEGNDHIIMDLTNYEGWQGHHAYGGRGEDRFEFRDIDEIESPIMGRIDDLNLSEDSIWIEGVKIDLYNPPEGVRVVSYLGQQWLSIEDKALYALEGARDGGSERHFSGLPENGIASLPTVEFVDQRNFIPVDLLPGDRSALNDIEGSGDQSTYDGTAGADWYHDYEVNEFDASGNQTNTADMLIRMGDGDDFIDAGKGHDRARGGAGDDVIAGGSDDDNLYGDGGNDTLFGGSENDFVEGGDGADLLFGGTGNDKLAGNAGDDVMHGEIGNDRLTGHEGRDELYGEAGDDKLYGGDGDDFIYGGDGRDYLSGASGNDQMFGGDGRDRLKGHAGDDVMDGEAGNDNLLGGAGNDTLRGGDGRDVLTGGGGRDVLNGGAGVDKFVFHGGNMVGWEATSGTIEERSLQLDQIEDFEIGEDLVRFTASSGVHGMDDISAWQTVIEGNTYFTLNIEATDERILVDVDDNATWSDFYDEGNFLFG